MVSSLCTFTFLYLIFLFFRDNLCFLFVKGKWIISALERRTALNLTSQINMQSFKLCKQCWHWNQVFTSFLSLSLQLLKSPACPTIRHWMYFFRSLVESLLQNNVYNYLLISAKCRSEKFSLVHWYDSLFLWLCFVHLKDRLSHAAESKLFLSTENKP